MCEYLSFYFLRKKMQCHLLDVFVQSLLWHIRIVLISPYKKHATTAAVAIGGATSTPVGSQSAMHRGVRVRVRLLFRRKQHISWYAGTRYLVRTWYQVPGTKYEVHFFSHTYVFRPRKKKTIITEGDQQH